MREKKSLRSLEISGMNMLRRLIKEEVREQLQQMKSSRDLDERPMSRQSGPMEEGSEMSRRREPRGWSLFGPMDEREEMSKRRESRGWNLFGPMEEDEETPRRSGRRGGFFGPWEEGPEMSRRREQRARNNELSERDYSEDDLLKDANEMLKTKPLRKRARSTRRSS